MQHRRLLFSPRLTGPAVGAPAKLALGLWAMPSHCRERKLDDRVEQPDYVPYLSFKLSLSY